MTIIVEHIDGREPRTTRRTELQDVNTVAQALERLRFASETGLIFLVNGRVGHWDSELKDGDLLQVIPAISGG